MFYVYYITAWILDLLIGDPQRLPHPVQAIGYLCNVFEERSRRVFIEARIAGIVTTVSVLTVTVMVIGLVLMLFHKLLPIVEILLAVILLASGLACKSLRDHSMKVHALLAEDAEISVIRKEVGRIVGRDTTNLDRPDIVRATVETVAENMVDGITAPLMYGVLFSMLPNGGVLAPVSMAVIGTYLYKAINTMDSMHGYKNEKYIEFGRFAAKTDDVANFLPARISSAVMVVSGRMLGMNVKNGWRIFLRDRFNHASPNSGHAEAMVAGLLDVQLGGASSYFGKRIEKPTIGDCTRSLVESDIIITNRLVFLTSSVFLCLLLSLRYLLMGG